MKRILLCSLISCALLAACAPQKRTTVYRPPFPRDETQIEVPPAPEGPASTVANTPAPTPAPAPSATPTPKKREALYAIPEPGRPGFYRSPYNPQGGLLDCRGYPPGTEMKDEYAPGKTFLIP